MSLQQVKFITVFKIVFCTTLFAQNVPENLGLNVNTEYNEINPVVSADGKTLYFSRVSHPQNTHGLGGSQDIWFSEIYEGKWQMSRRMGFPLNKEEYNCAYSVTPDGNTLLIMGEYEKGNYKTRGFSLVKRTNVGWSQPEKLEIPDLVKLSRGLYMSGYLLNDGKTLLMAFGEKKNSAKDDIYVSTLQKNGFWTRPTSLGEDICTDQFTETTPFMASDGVTLFFSSDREGGQGSNDIYYTKRLDKTWKRWSKPVNLGPTVNTDGYDAYYSVDAAGEYAYMVSKKGGTGRGDIVRLKLKEDKPAGGEVAQPTLPKPDPVTLVSGKVIDEKTGKPVDARIELVDLENGEVAGTAQTDPATGQYKLVLPLGKKYGLHAIAKDFLAESKNIDLTKATEYKEIDGSNLKLVPIEEGSKVEITNLFFDTGKATIRSDSYPELDRWVTTFNENKSMAVELGGHTDNVGSDQSNIKLSQDRADAVREYFISKGIEPDRVQSKGYGETTPKATNETEEGRQANRRVEFKVLKK